MDYDLQLYIKRFSQHHSLASLDLHTEHVKLYGRSELPLPFKQFFENNNFSPRIAIWDTAVQHY